MILLSSCSSPINRTNGLVDEINDDKIEVSDPQLTAVVPDLTKMTPLSATEKLESAGFTNVVCETQDNWDVDKQIVTDQNIQPGIEINLDEEIRLTCKKICVINFNIKSETNLLFSRYDIEVYFDDELIGTVANGKTLSVKKEVIEGNYEIQAVNAEKNSVKEIKKIELKGNITFSCELAHGNSSIEYKNASITNDPDSVSYQMVDVTGMTLQDAEEELLSIGFLNVVGEPSEKITDKSSWLVVSQNKKTDSITSITDSIILDCEHLDVYFSNNYAGKSLDVVQKLAEIEEFTLHYRETDTLIDLDRTIGDLPEDNKPYWIVDSAKNYGAEHRAAELSLTYLGTPEEQASKQASIDESIKESEIAESEAEESRSIAEAEAEESRSIAESEAEVSKSIAESEAEESRSIAESEAEESRRVAESEEASREAESLAQASKEAAEKAAAEQASKEAELARQASESAVRDYIANTNTYKFHYPNCKSVKKMSESNKWYFTGTRDQLIGQGYSPCQNCNP